MDRTFKPIVFFAAAALFLGSAAVLLFPHLRREDRSPHQQNAEQPDDLAPGNADGHEEDVAVLLKRRSDRSALNPAKTLAERDKAKYDVGEMRNEAEDMLRRFRGSPEERRDVINECREGTDLLRMIGDLAAESYELMTPEELEKAREEFEKNYRAQLDYLQSGRLQRMLKTPEEQEVIGSTFEAAQDFLERLDEALNAAGY